MGSGRTKGWEIGEQLNKMCLDSKMARFGKGWKQKYLKGWEAAEQKGEKWENIRVGSRRAR